MCGYHPPHPLVVLHCGHVSCDTHTQCSWCWRVIVYRHLVKKGHGILLLRMLHVVVLVLLYNMYVCVVITYSRVWINRVRLPILLVVS